jgi:CRISPR/Cas system-associated exonuclease Cas4 (RecB family)
MSSVVALLRQEKIDLHVSVSAIRTLEGCPRQWWYRYAAGISPEDTPARLILGGAIHKALAFFYRTLRDDGVEPSSDDLVSVAGVALGKAVAGDTPILFAQGEDAEGLVVEAQRLLTAFVESGYRPARILAVEEPFAVPLMDPATGEVLPFEERLVGAVDLVCVADDGTAEVVDHKVSARVDKAKVSMPDTQLSLYSWAIREHLGLDDVKLRFQSLVRTKTAKVVVQDVARAPHDENEAIEAIASGLSLIHMVVSHPDGMRMMGRRRSWRCKDCSWRRRCAQDRT